MSIFNKVILSVLLAACFGGSAIAQTSFTAKDAAAATQTFKSFNCSSTICSLSVPADTTGAAFGVTGNPFYVIFPTAQAVTATLGAETTKVIGTVNQGTSPWVVSLPTGASTSAKQDTMITSLGTIATNSGLAIPAGTNAIGYLSAFSYAHISTATTTTVKSGAGAVHTITINNLGTVASTTTVYDNTAGSGTVIAVINTLASQVSYVYDVAFSTGLTLVTTGTVAPDVTVSYR